MTMHRATRAGKVQEGGKVPLVTEVICILEQRNCSKWDLSGS